MLNGKELRVPVINVHDTNDDENHKKLDETRITKLRMLRRLRMQLTMNMLKKHCLDMKEDAEETI